LFLLVFIDLYCYVLFRAHVPELASQFRENELILRLDMKGVAINYQSGFTTDIAEACIWLTPFIKEPGNFWDLRFEVFLSLIVNCTVEAAYCGHP
jgi:hypothetical protein